MPDLLTVLNNAQSEAPVNAAGASPAYNPFENLRQEYSHNGLADILNQETGVSNTPINVEDLNDYIPYGVYLNDIDTEADVNRVRSKNQSVMEQMGRMFGQSVVDRIALGTLRGFSDMLDPVYSFLTGEELQDYTNPVSAKIEEWQNDIRDRWEIYRKDPTKGIDLTDFAWYMNGLTDTVSTIALMIPGASLAKGIGYVSKALKLASLANKGLSKLGLGARAIQNINEGTKLLGTAGLMRIGENYQEARENYNDIKNSTLGMLTNMTDDDRNKLYSRRPDFVNMSDEEISTKLAEEGATNTFMDDMWLIGLDALQLRSIGNMWKGFTNRATNTAIREAQSAMRRNLVGQVSEEIADVGTRGINRKFSKFIPTLDTLKNYAAEWTEGLEEAWQYARQNQNAAIAKNTLDPTYQIPAFSDYLNDSQMWNSAIWGFVGGALFQGGATLYQNALDKITKRADVGTKGRIEEINGRIATINAFLQDLSDAQEKRAPRLNEKGNFVRDINGDVIYDDLGDEEAALRVEEIKNKYILKLVTDAANKGNYDLLKETFDSPEGRKYIENFDNLDVNANDFVQDVVSRMDRTYDSYLDELKNVEDAGIKNPNIISQIAYTNTAKKVILNDLEQRYNAIDSHLNDTYNSVYDTLNPTDQAILSNAFDEYVDKAKYNTLQSYIDRLDAQKELNNVLHESGKLGDIEFEREQKSIDKQIEKVAKEYGVEKDGVLLTKVDDVRNFLNDENNLVSNDTQDIIDGYSPYLLEVLSDREANTLSRYITKADIINTKQGYAEANNMWTKIYDTARAATYEAAKAEMVRIYNSAPDIDSVTNYLRTRQKGGLSDEIANNISDAYTTMSDFAGESDDVEAELDKIAKDAKNKRNAPPISTPEGSVSESSMRVENGTQAETEEPTTTEEPSDVENNNPVEEVPVPTPEIITSPIVSQPVSDEGSPVREEEPPIDVAENNVFANFAEEQRQEVRREVDIQNRVRNIISPFTGELENLTVDEIYNRVFTELNKDIGKDAIIENENTIKSYIKSVKAFAALRARINPARSAVDFTSILINPTNDQVINFLEDYAKARKINTFDKRIPISIRSVIRYIYDEVNKESPNNPLDVTTAYRLYENIIEGLKLGRKNFIIREKLDQRNKYSIEDIALILSETKRTPIQNDSRINLSIVGTTSHNAANYAMSKINEGSQIVVKRNKQGNGIEFFTSGTKIGYNIFNVVNGGYRHFTKFGFSYTLYKNGDNYSSPIENVYQAIIDITDKEFNVNGETIKIKAEDAKYLRSVIEANTIDDKMFDKLKDNSVVKYMYAAGIISSITPKVLIGVSENRNGKRIRTDNTIQRLKNVLNYIIDNDVTLSDIDNPEILKRNVHDWVIRQYENYAFTQKLYDVIGDNDHGIRVPVKSLNRGKPLDDDIEKPLTEAFTESSINGTEIVILINGNKISERGTVNQHISDNPVSYPNLFQIALRNGTSYPEFVDIAKADWSPTNEFGAAVEDEIVTLIKNHINSKDDKSFEELDRKLKQIFGVNSIITESKFINIFDGENNYTERLIIGSPNDSRAKITIHRYNKDNSVAHNISIRTDNKSKPYNIITSSTENAESAIRDAVRYILTGAKYTFPGAIVLSGVNSDINSYIRKTSDGFKIKIGAFDKTYPTYAAFMIRNNLATTTLSKVTYNRGTQSEVEDNYDYFANNEDYRNNRANARLTLEPNPVITRYTESELNKLEDSENNRIENINKLKAEGNRNLYEMQSFVQTVAPTVSTIFFDKNYEGMSLQTILSDSVDIKPETLYINDERMSEKDTSAIFDKINKRIVLYKPFFDKALDNNNGEYKAMRILLHESIHKQILDNSIAMNTSILNTKMGEVWDALNRAINDENSQEYKDLKVSYGDSIEVCIKDLKEGLDTINSNAKNDVTYRNEELIVEAITSKTFSDILNHINTKNEKVGEPKSLLQKILQFIRNLFNFGRNGNNKIKDDTLLAKVFNALTEEINNKLGDNLKQPKPDNTQTGEKPSKPANIQTGENYDIPDDDGFDDDFRNNDAFSSVDFDTLQIPSRNVLFDSLTFEQNASVTSLIERGELQMRCL